jgi:hypothetical protein
MSNLLENLNTSIFDDEYVLIDEDITPSEEEKPNEEATPEKVVGKEEDEGEESTESGSESLPNLYSSLAKALGEEGFLPDLNDEDVKAIDSFDKLGDRIKQANKKTLTESLGFSLDNVNELNDLQKQYLQALNQGIPAETFVEAKRTEQSIDSITDDLIESNEELRKNIIIDGYVAKGITQAKAEKMAQMHIDLAEDVEEAKAARNEIRAAIQYRNQQEFEYQKTLYEENIKQQKEYEESLRNSFYNTDKIGETFEITRQLKDKMYSVITKPVAKTEDGTLVNAITKYQMENPIDFQHKMAWLYAITDGFKKFDTFVTTKAKTKAARELESVLNSTNFDSLGNVSTPEHDDAAIYGIRDYKFDEEA